MDSNLSDGLVPLPLPFFTRLDSFSQSTSILFSCASRMARSLALRSLLT